MSRLDSGKSPRISTPGRPSPRKLPLYSPSELSPFSFNEDTLKILATDIEQQNGLIPMNIPLSVGASSNAGRCFSQPQTPSEERRSILQDSFVPRRVPSSPLNANSSFTFHPTPPSVPHGLSQSHSFSGHGSSAQLLSHSVGASSAGTPGKSMREYDESFKEMKKENFNLKLRIFFLEERLGLGKKTPSDELANANLELKIQLESCKQDLAEKNSLLAEASVALDDLEKQVESQKLVIKNFEDRLHEANSTTKFELGSVPKKMSRSPDVSRKPLMSPKFPHKNYFFAQDDMRNNNPKELKILKEDEEMSDSESKCKGYLLKIKQLEESLKLSQNTQKQLTESLQKSKNELNVMSNKLKNPSFEIDMSGGQKTELRFQMRRDFGVQTSHTDHCNNANIKREPSPDKLLEECHGLKSENRKIRDQLKLQVQERKLLLKKISMLKEQLGSVSETEHKTLPVMENVRPPTSCADIGTQCDTIDNENNNAQDIITNIGQHQDEIDDRIDNPLSDTSTWNTELPNIADMQLCSSPELLFDCDSADKPHHMLNETGLSSTLIEHLSQQLESYKSQISAKMDYIATLEDDIASKDDVIKDQNHTIKEYRKEIVRMDESMYHPKYCPVLDNKEKRQSRRRRKVKLRGRSNVSHMICGAGLRDSFDSDQWSEPELGVSISRIGLPNSYPEMMGGCDCDQNSLLSDDDKSNKKFYSLDFSHVVNEDFSSEIEALPQPQTDYSSIIEELKSHRKEIKKLHQECSGLGEVECSSNMCLSSGARVLEGLLSTLIHEVDVLQSLDSGIDTSEENDNDDTPFEDTHLDSDKFSLCSSCTSSIPKEFDDFIKRTHLGLSSVVSELEIVKRKFTRLLNKHKQLASKDKDDVIKSEETKTRLNENYILIAKLSSENLRLLGEYSKLESSLEELKKSSVDIELRLQDEICALNGKLIEKEREVEKLQLKVNDFERKAAEMSSRLENLQERISQNKMSPDTSSSFDYYPSRSHESYRPRAFSAVSSSPKSYKGKLGKDPKLLEVSSPDLGVDLMMESDMYSSLERGNTSKVGSLAFEKIVQENRSLRHEKEILTHKLGRSKSALQETLLRLSKSNMQKQDQMGSPSLHRRGLAPSRSHGGLVSTSNNTLDQSDLSFSGIGTKPKQFASGQGHK